MNKKFIIIAISVAIIVGIVGLTANEFVRQNSTNNMPLIIENDTKIPSTPAPRGHNIEVNLNESMHFSAH